MKDVINKRKTNIRKTTTTEERTEGNRKKKNMEELKQKG